MKVTNFQFLKLAVCLQNMNDGISTVNFLIFQTLFSFCSLKEMLVIRTGIHKMYVRVANREDPDQTASEEAV